MIADIHISQPTQMAVPSNPLDALIRAHIDLVYAAALRKLRDPHLAADVTQAVFLILQSKYPLPAGAILPAWLLRATRYAALAALQRQRRRLHHEQKAAAMRNPHAQPAPDHELSSLIDAALDRLAHADRAAIVLTYFEGLTHPQLAARLKITPAAAHKRVQRALDRLRKILDKKGLALPAAGLASALALFAKPAAAPAAVTSAALAGHAPAAISSIAKGALLMMKLLKVKAAAIAAALIVAASLSGTVLYQHAFAQGQPGPSAPAAVPSPIQNAGAGQLVLTPADDTPFTPEISLTLYHEPTHRDFLLDLDRGRTLLPVAGLRNSFEVGNWVTRAGVDLLFDGSRTDVLFGIDLALVPINPDEYAKQNADQPHNDLNRLLSATPGTPALVPISALPAAYLFRTREGSVGRFEVTAVQENPRAALLRVHLLKPAVRDAQAVSLATAVVLPEFRNQAQRLAAAGSDDEIRAAVIAVSNTHTALRELLRGTPFQTKYRAFDTAIRMMNERIEDQEPDQAKERAADILQDIDRVSADLQRAAARPATPDHP